MALSAACDAAVPHIVRAIVNDDGAPPPASFILVPCSINETVGQVWLEGSNTFAAYVPPTPEGPWFFTLGADQSTSLNTLVDVPGWSLQLFPNKRYKFDLNLWFRTAATTTGILFTITGPSSPVTFDVTAETALTTSTMSVQRITAYDGGSPTPSIDAANADRLARLSGYIQTGASGGALKLRARSEVSSSLVTLRQGSSGQIWVV